MGNADRFGLPRFVKTLVTITLKKKEARWWEKPFKNFSLGEACCPINIWASAGVRTYRRYESEEEEGED